MELFDDELVVLEEGAELLVEGLQGCCYSALVVLM